MSPVHPYVPVKLVIQWNPSNPDIIGPESVMVSRCPYLRGEKTHTQTQYSGRQKVVLFFEVSSFQGCPDYGSSY